eukprot:COSAG02_NODE_2211_length_9495_cov_3.415842_12_plen_87_part_00
MQAVRSKQELWRRTTEQFQEAAFAEQKEMARRIKYVDKKLQQHVREWAEIMDLFRKKYGVGPGDKAGTQGPTRTKKKKKKAKKTKD